MDEIQKENTRRGDRNGENDQKTNEEAKECRKNLKEKEDILRTIIETQRMKAKETSEIRWFQETEEIGRAHV